MVFGSAAREGWCRVGWWGSCCFQSALSTHAVTGTLRDSTESRTATTCQLPADVQDQVVDPGPVHNHRSPVAEPKTTPPPHKVVVGFGPIMDQFRAAQWALCCGHLLKCRSHDWSISMRFFLIFYFLYNLYSWLPLPKLYDLRCLGFGPTDVSEHQEWVFAHLIIVRWWFHNLFHVFMYWYLLPDKRSLFCIFLLKDNVQVEKTNFQCQLTWQPNLLLSTGFLTRLVFCIHNSACVWMRTNCPVVTGRQHQLLLLTC